MPKPSIGFTLVKGWRRGGLKYWTTNSFYTLPKCLEKSSADELTILDDVRVLCLPCDLLAPNLDLSSEDRSCIVGEDTHIIHSAWDVNFNLGLKSFESQVANTRGLIEIAHIGGAEFFIISSTATAYDTVSGIVTEKVSSERKDASAPGYSRSKWVVEQICAAAHTQIIEAGSTGSGVKSRISIIRAGQLCGNRFDIWNMNEAYPLFVFDGEADILSP
ncbi:hypothetical protein ANO14919_024920 [Xylariales sp. No.14919]|nr:hypothetical protein ANO14919_024920 [Xylariales sp. No.14919]